MKKSIASMADGMMGKNDEINAIKEEMIKAYSMLADLKGKQILKKLKNLGNDEFNQKNKILKISEGDILLVDDPTIVSYKVLTYLRNKVNIIISKKKVMSSFLSKNRISIVSHKNLELDENEYYAVVDKVQLDKETNDINLIDNLIEAYKRERGNNGILEEEVQDL